MDQIPDHVKIRANRGLVLHPRDRHFEDVAKIDREFRVRIGYLIQNAGVEIEQLLLTTIQITSVLNCLDLVYIQYHPLFFLPLGS
jgi:hypothetical protein